MAYKDKEKQRAYAREHYEKNRDAYIQRAKDHRSVMHGRSREFIYEYLLAHPCVDCGEADPVCLEFDHLRDKEHNISDMMRRGYGVDAIRDEIEKCEVVCANCHRRRTNHQFNWWRSNHGSFA